jgi:2-oxoglutarate dehydrogenase E1 component
MDELSEGKFLPIIDELDEDINKSEAKRVVLCAGKVYYDLLQKRRDENITDVALIRVEQLYPYPEKDISEILAQYTHIKEIFWCQEEPRNQGAWYNSQHRFYRTCHEVHPNTILQFAGRKPSASPAAGYMALHVSEQEAFINDALGI